MPTLHGAGETIALARNVVTACCLVALTDQSYTFRNERKSLTTQKTTNRQALVPMKRVMRPKGWTESDVIRWVENRLAEQQDPYLKRDAVPPAENLEIYLDREKDNLTLGQIAKKRFSTINRPGSGTKWASNPAIGRVRCALRQVEAFLNPQPPQLARRIRKEKKIERELQEYGIPAGVVRSASGCSPEYLLKQLQSKSNHEGKKARVKEDLSLEK